ncbi:GNAT family N-acetyltransferase [Stackebrandtia soli]|uniref:GNAT family N-acetyltransferase n=1 Tax=Stackebrandtia soli TaxID=1892856 RepID=UPI0039EBB605
MHIRPTTPNDAAAILTIHQHGIDTGNATFATTTPTWPEFDATHHAQHRFIATDETGPLGWIAVTPTSHRPVYAGVVESSVYIHPRAHNRGVGTALLHTLIHSCDNADIWTIQAGIFPENTASLRLHTNAGFRVVGTSTRIGKHHGRWRDVTRLERRSTTVGVD